MIVAILAGAAGGTEAAWREALGAVEVLPIVYHPRCNWRFDPICSKADRATIDLALDLVRAQHPYVRDEQR